MLVDCITVNQSRNAKAGKSFHLPFPPVHCLETLSIIKFTTGKFSTAFNKGTLMDILGPDTVVRSLKLGLRDAMLQFHTLFTLASFSTGACAPNFSLSFYLRCWFQLPSPSCHLCPLSMTHYGGCFSPLKVPCSGFSLSKRPSLQPLVLE